MPKPTTVYPIPGRFLPGYRLEVHDVESAAEADRLVATGLYARSEAEAEALAWSAPEATEATEANVHHPADHDEPEAPAAGSDEAPSSPPAQEG